MCTIALALLALGAPVSVPQDPSRAREDLVLRIEALVREELDTGDSDTIGVSILATGDAWLERTWAKSAGEKKHDTFRAGSLTAQLAALAIAELVQQKKLALDVTLGAQLGEELAEPLRPVTLQQLLAHTSGIPSCAGWLEARERSGKPTMRKDLVAWLEEQQLDTAPGECRAYSNTNVILAAWVAEKAAGEPLERWAPRALFAPAGLERTGYTCAEPPVRETASASQEFAGELGPDGRGGRFFAARDLCSTTTELARFLRWNATRSEGAWRVLTAGASGGGETPYALGFEIAPLEERPCVSFGGGMAGSRIHVAWYPEHDVAIAVCAESERARVDRLERRIARAFLDIGEPEIVDLPLASEQRSIYTGTYMLGCTRIAVEVQGERLTVAYPDRPAIALKFQGDHRFVTVDDPELRFQFVSRGARAESFTIQDHGSQSEALRVE